MSSSVGAKKNQNGLKAALQALFSQSDTSSKPLSSTFAILFYLLTLACACLKPTPVGYLFPLTAACGFYLCSKYKWLGFNIHVAFVLMLFFFVKGLTLWHGGILLSLLSSSILVTLQTLSTTALKQEEEVIGAKIDFLEERLKKREEEMDEERRELQTEIERWKEEAKQRRIEKQMIENQLTLLSSQVDELVVQKDQIRADYLLAKEEAYALKRNQEKEAQVVVPAPVVAVENADALDLKKQFAIVQGKYIQLREQFEEKKRVLSDTRIELFALETRLLKMEREYQENRFDFSLSDLQILEKALAEQEKQNLSLQEEIRVLEEIISFI